MKMSKERDIAIQNQDRIILDLMEQGWTFGEITPTTDERLALKAFHPTYGTVVGKDTTGYWATWHCIGQCVVERL
jgi:hypothetical protein